jgi:hypothetical protein
MTDSVNERDLVATDEMIRNLRAGTFKKFAVGAGACGALLLVGASLLVWTWRHGNDPEVLKEALRHMPPLQVTVKLDPDSRTVKLEQPAVVRLEQPRSVLSNVPTGNNGSHDPAIQTSVTMFKTVAHGSGSVVSGWRFANGAAKAPESQYCYYTYENASGLHIKQDIGEDGTMLAGLTGSDQRERFAQCKWFSGNLG